MNNSSKPWFFDKLVLPQHVDHAAVLWHGSYINFLEEARIISLSQVGLDYSKLSLKGFEIPVVSLEIQYLKSIKIGDYIKLESHFKNSKGIRKSWITNFKSQNDLIHAKSKVELVLVQKRGNSFKIIKEPPQFVENAFFNLAKGPV
tara:strand:+ start:88 stop:525 length:438 start_codon:yes stop_codon:yes gene_type:complete